MHPDGSIEPPVPVLLPGMDGTGHLFEPLLAHLPDAIALSYPDDLWRYDDAEAFVRSKLPPGRFVLVAESFSGPVGIRIAADPPPGLAGLCLIATFARSPLPLPLPPRAWLRLAFGLPPPRAFVRRWMLDRSAPETLVEAVRAAIARVPPSTLAQRAQQIGRVDVTGSLSRIACPWRYLRARDDRLVRSGSLSTILVHRPDLMVVEIAGPHLLAQARPDRVASALRTLLGG